ncbi:restriction endonuclease [Mesorhizobium sp. M0904]|uniref:restriction endonuclease n=1 Tax=unclassified Mesorhizobium TaxID=325217 RepID=UPI00333CDCB1
MPKISKLVQRIHFEDFGGPEFERLVFAYHVRAGWTDVAWYGQAGGDHGRDIVGVERLDDGPPRRSVIQCVNRSSLTQAKAEHDIQRLLSSPTKFEALKFVTRGAVSASRRDAVQKFAKANGIDNLSIWGGAELEEHLRLIGEDLLKRFCEGEEFPDKAAELTRFAEDFAGLSDMDALAQMAIVFDRPAFRTPFQQECSLHAFRQAIDDTISALNTGIWRTREGDEIRRIPSLHHLRDRHKKTSVSRSVQLVDQLRRAFASGLRDKTIRPCGCGNPDCPVFTVDSDVAVRLNQIRSGALAAFRDAYPKFHVEVG